MNRIVNKYHDIRDAWWRLNRLLFPSPDEIKLIEIMGGKVFKIKWLKHPLTEFPLAIVINLGRALKDERFRREKQVGRYYIDLGNDILWGIEVEGHHWHRDVVAEFDRDSYLYQRGWRIKRISPVRLWLEPSVVQTELLKFLNA